MVLAVALVLVGCTQAPAGNGTGNGNGPLTVDPRLTDPAIPTDLVFPHIVQGPTAAPRGRLAVVLHGSGANPQGYTELIAALANDGYHVVGLRYNALLPSLGACPDADADQDPDCHRTFRGETVFGQGVPDPAGHAFDHPIAFVPKASSVMNRLLRLVAYMSANYPSAGFGQFLRQTASGTCTSPNTTYGTCDVDWSKVVLMGHSQGAAVALYLAKFFAVDRVGLMSGTYDAYALGAGVYSAAPWLTDGPLAVPTSRIGWFVSTRDPEVGRLRAVATALALSGQETDVTTTARPFGGSHRLVSSTTPSCPFDTAQNHNSTAVDLCVPDGLYVAAWRYLAGGS